MCVCIWVVSDTLKPLLWTEKSKTNTKKMRICLSRERYIKRKAVLRVLKKLCVCMFEERTKHFKTCTINRRKKIHVDIENCVCPSGWTNEWVKEWSTQRFFTSFRARIPWAYEDSHQVRGNPWETTLIWNSLVTYLLLHLSPSWLLLWKKCLLITKHSNCNRLIWLKI